MTRALDDLKRRFGAAELLDLARGEGLHHRGSGLRRAECPGCRNGDVRGVSIGEKNGVGLWHCFRDSSHGGSAIDFLALARNIDLRPAMAELERLVGTIRASPPERAVPQRTYPPAAEVAETWHRALPISAVADVADAWRARGLDVAGIEERDLARALRFGVRLPRWAWGPGGAWSEGPHRLLLPMFDAQGQLVSLHARAAKGKGVKSKGLSPAGHAIAGSIMADALAQRILRGEVRHRDVLIAEGGPDFLAWGTRLGDAIETAPAVFSVISGSWTPEIAAHIPSRVRVGVATHEDSAGEEYAAVVARTLRGRCTVVRVRLREAA